MSQVKQKRISQLVFFNLWIMLAKPIPIRPWLKKIVSCQKGSQSTENSKIIRLIWPTYQSFTDQTTTIRKVIFSWYNGDGNRQRGASIFFSNKFWTEDKCLYKSYNGDLVIVKLVGKHILVKVSNVYAPNDHNLTVQITTT